MNNSNTINNNFTNKINNNNNNNNLVSNNNNNNNETNYNKMSIQSIMLYNILSLFVTYRQDIGYRQGMSQIAGYLIIQLNN